MSRRGNCRDMCRDFRRLRGAFFCLRRTVNGRCQRKLGCERHLDEVFVKINGVQPCLWRAVDHEGEVLESYVTKRRNRTAALKFLRKAVKRYGPAEAIVTDRLRSYSAVTKVIGNVVRQDTGRWKNTLAENFHLPFRRRKRAMRRFRRMRILQKFVSVHAFVFNHFNQERSLSQRHHFKMNCTAALAGWRGLCAA